MEGEENSRMYNEMALIKMIESLRNMLQRPPKVFEDEIKQHFKERLPRYDFLLKSAEVYVIIFLVERICSVCNTHFLNFS